MFIERNKKETIKYRIESYTYDIYFKGECLQNYVLYFGIYNLKGIYRCKLRGEGMLGCRQRMKLSFCVSSLPGTVLHQGDR